MTAAKRKAAPSIAKLAVVPAGPPGVSAYVEYSTLTEIRIDGPLAAEIRRQLAWINYAQDQFDQGECDIEVFSRELNDAVQAISRLTLDVEFVELACRSLAAANAAKAVT